jgi:hypothetical protein
MAKQVLNHRVERLLIEARLHKGCRDRRIFDYFKSKLTSARDLYDAVTPEEYEAAIKTLTQILEV